MKRFAMTVVLTCVLSGSALAGDIPTVGVTATPPTPTAAGEIPTGGYAQEMLGASLALVEFVLGAVV